MEWKLIPKAGREPYNECDDKTYLKAWKRRAIQFIESTDISNDFDWLAIAQHYGLVTRLLDWTYNPLVAAFFAAYGVINPQEDAVVYAYMTNREIYPNDMEFFEYKGVVKIRPNGLTRRIVNQGGLFTIHNPPGSDLANNMNQEDRLEIIRIKKDYIRQLIFDLSYYGINIFSIFPDLDRLSSHANWYMENKNYWSDDTNFDNILDT